MREFCSADSNQLKYIVGFGAFNLGLYILYPLIKAGIAADSAFQQKSEYCFFILYFFSKFLSFQTHGSPYRIVVLKTNIKYFCHKKLCASEIVPSTCSHFPKKIFLESQENGKTQSLPGLGV